MVTPHELRVVVVSPEEAEHGVAELWSDGKLFGFTRLEDGELLLRIEPRQDHMPVVVGARNLAGALADAVQLLGGGSPTSFDREAPPGSRSA
jgi:hypothetical protein